MEELHALQHELDSWKCCTHGIRGECILVTKPVVCNKALSRFGFSLAETDPDVLTLFVTDNDALYCQNDDIIAFVEIVLRLIREHESIKCFCFRWVHIDILGPILGSLAARSDVRELILNTIRYRRGDDAYTQPYGGIATFPSTTEDYKIGTPMGTAAMILKVVRQAQSLEVFEFKQEVIHADVAIELGRELAKKRSLKTLSLGPRCRNVLSSYVSTLDAMQPADKVCNLKSVTLCGDIYHDRSCDSLLSNASITYLDLSGCVYVGYPMCCSGMLIDPFLQELANTLSRNSSVKVLILKNKGFGQEGAEALGRLMVSNTTIRTLDISRNALGTDECTALAGGLRMARGLREVIMKGCHITPTGAMAMYEALRENQFNISVVFGTGFTLTKRMLELDMLVPRIRREFPMNSDEMLGGSSLLMQPQHFKEITLEWNNGNYFPLDKLCTFLQQDGVLVESMSLDLSNLSRDLVQQLAGCLQRRKGIQALSVNNYGETDE
ncbi:uncharacterized protein LOC135379019 [Ornithodoros turicata]|uniref:uncharacterized protein LOC135379019 n=1 Tax=Ornithodoros turicata TaxID=34597 RepID=UPI0031395213